MPQMKLSRSWNGNLKRNFSEKFIDGVIAYRCTSSTQLNYVVYASQYISSGMFIYDCDYQLSSVKAAEVHQHHHQRKYETQPAFR